MRRIAALLLGLSLLFAGCSKTGTAGGGGGSAPGGRVLRVALYAEPTSLNPLLASNTAENFLASLAFDELVTLDASGNDVADLAAQVPTVQNGGISKDGTTITYHLRRGVKWQDGAPFSSADVKFSWQAVMNPDNNVVERRGYDQVRSVDTPDAYTAVFHLKQPFAPFVDTVFGESDDPYRIVPKHILGKYKNINQVPFNQQPIGTGPFKVARWIHGDHVAYAANPYYFRGTPKLKGIDVYTVPDGNTQEAQMRAHDMDLAIDFSTANLAHLRSNPAPGVTTLLVMPNLYGDVLSDVAAQITGSVGLAGSANIGDHCSMFEAIHGSAPRRAGQNLANPSGLMHGALLMLAHIGQGDIAETIHNAWLKTIEDGVHTYDIYKEGVSKQKVGTKEFADAIVARLGQKPSHLTPVEYAKGAQMDISVRAAGATPKKQHVGVDLFLDEPGGNPDRIAEKLRAFTVPGAKLTVIGNRGTKVWPNGNPDTFWSDHWACRFESDGGAFNTGHVVQLIEAVTNAGFEVIKTEGLYSFDGARGFSLAQGQ